MPLTCTISMLFSTHDRKKKLLDQLLFSIRVNPVTALLGPRQCGKTTLAHSVHQFQPINLFDLENPIDRAALRNPIMVLGDLSGLVVLDEIHRMPELYEILRVLVDDQSCKAKFLVLGSSSPQIIREVSETLAGRIGFVDMSGFSLQEVSDYSWRDLWLRGGFPRSFLAESQVASIRWREDFTRTFLERDIPLLGFRISPKAMRKFWTMLAHYHGQKWNAAEFSRYLGETEKTAASYLDILCGTFMVRKLQPSYVNMKKRQVRSPKIFIRDSGVLHSLLSIQSSRDLLSHIKAGASWEGFALEQVLSLTGDRKAWFWGTHSGAEIDLLIDPEGVNLGFEFKLTENIRTTKSMRIALEDLGLNKLYLVHPGKRTFRLDERITALSISDLVSELAPYTS